MKSVLQEYRANPSPQHAKTLMICSLCFPYFKQLSQREFAIQKKTHQKLCSHFELIEFQGSQIVIDAIKETEPANSSLKGMYFLLEGSCGEFTTRNKDECITDSQFLDQIYEFRLMEDYLPVSIDPSNFSLLDLFALSPKIKTDLEMNFDHISGSTNEIISSRQ